MDYTIVIPTFNSEFTLKKLLDSIFAHQDLYPPTRILIIDDCSTDGTRFVPDLFSVDYRRLDKQSGPLFAEKIGIELVETEAFVVIHADAQLGNPKEARAANPIDKLVCFLAKAKHSDFDIVGIAPYILQSERRHRVQGGPRMVQEEIDKLLPQSIYRDHAFGSILRITESIKAKQFEPVHSFDNYCYILKTDAYHEAGGFDTNFSPYLFYHDDLFGRIRQHNHDLFITTEVILFHPINSRYKTEEYLSIVDDKLFDRNVKYFTEKWSNARQIWERNAILKIKLQEKLMATNRTNIRK